MDHRRELIAGWWRRIHWVQSRVARDAWPAYNDALVRRDAIAEAWGYIASYTGDEQIDGRGLSLADQLVLSGAIQ